jgi:hypothetical protein
MYFHVNIALQRINAGGVTLVASRRPRGAQTMKSNLVSLRALADAERLRIGMWASTSAVNWTTSGLIFMNINSITEKET